MTAHHGDDLIETILMKIVRGSSISGYSGFSKEVDKTSYKIIRPLISVTKEDIINYNKKHKLNYFIDKTNFDNFHTRNSYRKVVLPFLKKEDKNVHEKFLDEIFDYVKPIKEAEVLFKRLKEKGVKLAVVTSDMKLNTDAILEKTNLAQYFDLVIGKDNCTKAKKTGEPALIALKLLNANANTTISVGDAPMDYEMAKNANLKGSILVSTGQIPETKLKQLTDTTVQNLSEVIVK